MRSLHVCTTCWHALSTRGTRARPPPDVQGTAFQCLSGRLGLVTGKDLARHCGERYPRGARIFLWVMLEFAIVSGGQKAGSRALSAGVQQFRLGQAGR